ncbi:hypothetical protein GOP47_0009767 [Adiantum capillus-veneris]|uniref:UvrD-like helicase ATP-binding domain-containing protein n=1 Tax=Adiantum capillus-veneris TaxID=13818 RepID=A0A9D4UX82_ADICA|nr:hypothetical protein GOP47_0009767 [Adiantum capillus-veneris]
MMQDDHPSSACTSNTPENNVQMMDPAIIRYTHTTFPSTFSPPSLLKKAGPNLPASASGHGISYSVALKASRSQLSLSSLLSKLQAGDITVDSIPFIRVFCYNDSWYSLDNRRLWVFKQYGAPIPVIVTTSVSDFLHKFQPDADNQSAKLLPYRILNRSAVEDTMKQDLIELLFRWKRDDINNEDLLKSKMSIIPKSFDTLTEYFDSFKWPLVEELRSQLQKSLTDIDEAPYASILDICEDNNPQKHEDAKRFIELKLYLHWKDMPSKDGKQFKFKPKDLLLLTPKCPGSCGDQLSEWSLMAFIKHVEKEEEQETESSSSCLVHRILVKSTIDDAVYAELMDVEKTWYAVYLVGLATPCRMWKALHYSDGDENNYPIIRETLQHHPSAQLLLEHNAATADENVLKDNILTYCSLLHLNDSQADAVVKVLSDVKAGRNPGVRMIQGPPGTGKTSTIVALLSVATGTRMRCLAVCPTNTAIATVALRYMEMLQPHEKKQFGEFCESNTASDYKVLNKTDVILAGTEDKLPVEGPLKAIYLPKRVKRIKKASKGWNEAATSLTELDDTEVDCHAVEGETKPGSSQTIPTTPSTKLEELVKTLEEHSKALAEDLPAQQAKLFSRTAKQAAELLRCEKEFRGQALLLLKDELKRGIAATHQDFCSDESIENLCMENSSLIFCTVSTAGRNCVKQAAPFKCLIIDEAAQLVEAETAIVTRLPGLNHAILVGDHQQLPATVISKSSTECAYGRSLFERMMSLEHPCHLLNIQYRMHPAISLFPSSQFYQSHLHDGDNVTGDAYKVHEELLYGPYAFLDVSDGSEQTGDDGRSKKNWVEASVIVALIRTLRQACLEKKTGNLTVGIITPYSSQKDLLRQCFLKQRTEPLIVDVNSIDGFQGQEKDIIIISTVRSNKHGVIGFLKDYRRLNVAITRARYCLWIVGCNKTLSATQNVWTLLLQDVIHRGLFKRVNDDKLANAVIKAKRNLGEHLDLLQMGSAFFSNMLWKVLFSNDFKNAFLKISSLDKRHRILYKIRRLALGHHASRYKRVVEELEGLVEVHMVADLCLIWSIDVERDSLVQQVIKVWDVIDSSKLSIYVRRLQNAFSVYSEEYIERCKTRHLTWDDTLMRPATWKKSADFVWLKPHDKCAQNHHSEKSDLLTERSTVSESLLLMKFYAMSSGIAKNLLTATGGVELDLPFEVNEEESLIIKYPSSCFILGRSGTGKTTVLVTKLIQREQQSHISQHGFNKISEIPQRVLENPRSANRHIKQILVTLSPLLCAAIKKQISQIQSILSAEGELPLPGESHHDLVLDNEDEDKILGLLPDSFINIPETYFPMFLTFRRFLLMLGNSILNSPFERTKKNSLERREVDYKQFDSDYWPHMDHTLTRKFDSCTVYTEIASVIKGSIQAVKTAQGFLDKEMYLSSARKGQQLTLEQKGMIYVLFLQYEKLKMQRNDYDMADYVKNVYKRLSAGEYQGDIIDYVYIDEVQDFTPAQISLFSFLCSDPHEGYIFAGDTAQTIARGVNFRFSEARSLFYTDFTIAAPTNADSGARKKTKEFSPAFFHLSHNFRTHVGVVNMANSIVELIYYFFPHSIDKLEPETSLVWGQLPVLLKADGQDLAKEICKTNKNSSNQGHRFGAQQVILVRDEAQKTDLVNKIGKQGLILTVSGSKGLEFEDVLMYNFFTGSSLQSNWRVIYDYMYKNNLMTAHDPTKRSYPEFDVHKHSLLCSELKHIYVAVTRAKQRLWIYEESDNFFQPIIDYWMCQELLETKLLDVTFISQMAAQSTPDEWRKRGFEVLDQQQYDMAILCFERAGDQHNADLAKAASLRQFGEKQLNINRGVAIANLRKASEMFLTLQRPDIAARCCIKCGDYHKAGLIYSKHCKPQRFEDGGDCFLEAKSWVEAENAYFEGKCVKKCLDACFLAKHYERGLTFISQWTEGQGITVEQIHVYLKECAAIFYHQGKFDLMMMFVQAFPDIELKRVFLREKNCLAELLSIEEAAENYLQAAELAELTGEFLRMAELLEKGRKYNSAVRVLLFLIRKDFFWGEQRKGWPLHLQAIKKPEDLLQRVQKLAALAEDSVRQEVELEILLLFEKFQSLEDLIGRSQDSCTLKTKLFTSWKGINTVFKIFVSNQPTKNKNLNSIESFQAGNALLLKLVSLYVEWKKVILHCKEVVCGDTKDNVTREFCYDFFAVRPGKEAQACVVHCHEAYWFRGYKKGRAPVEIPNQEFSKLTARFWDEQVEETLKRVVSTISNHFTAHNESFQKLDPVKKSNLLLDLVEVANKVHSSQGTQMLTNTFQREMEMLLWPPLRQEKQMLLVQKLRMSARVVAFLDMTANNSTYVQQRSHTMEETARLQLMFPFLSEEWKSSNLNSLVQKMELWKDVDMWPSEVTGNAELAIDEYMLKTGEQLLHIFTLRHERMKNYINPLTFLTLVEKATVMSCAYDTLLHGTLLPLTLVTDFMCGEWQERINRKILASEATTHQKLLELIRNFAEVIIKLLEFRRVGVSDWFTPVGATGKAELPLMVQRLFTVLIVICINSRELDLRVHIMHILQQKFERNFHILQYLPDIYRLEIRKACRGFNPRRMSMVGLKRAFAISLSSMGDTLVMTRRCNEPCCCRPWHGVKTVDMVASTSIFNQLAAIGGIDLFNAQLENCSTSIKTCHISPGHPEKSYFEQQHKTKAGQEGTVAGQDISGGYFEREAYTRKVDELSCMPKDAMVAEGSNDQRLHELLDTRGELHQESSSLNPSHEKHRADDKNETKAGSGSGDGRGAAAADTLDSDDDVAKGDTAPQNENQPQSSRKNGQKKSKNGQKKSKHKQSGKRKK